MIWGGISPIFLVSISFITLLIAISAELLLGDRAISITIVDRGILASGIPTLKAALMAASNFTPRIELARPISSYTITDRRLAMVSMSPLSRKTPR